MTLAQAYERVPWHMRIKFVLARTIASWTKPFVCEVCGNEMGLLKFLVVEDPQEQQTYHIDVGDKCARDLEVRK